MIKITPSDLFQNACHYGQKASKWNPKMKPYLHSERQGVHIFDLNKTAEKMADLLNEVERLVKNNKIILFVSTKPQTQDILAQIHEDTGMPVISHKWLGGLLTNFTTIKERILYMKKLQQDFKSGDIQRFKKKEQVQLAKELVKLETALGAVSEMTRIPDALFVVDGFKDKIAIKEAKKMGIQVLGIADSNVDPDYFDYFVPANDDAMKSLEFILGHTVTAILQNRRK